MRIASSWLVFSSLTLITGCASDDAAPSHPGEAPHWGYDGAIGPDHWGDLHPDWAVARDGRRQSPVNIDRSTVQLGDLPDLHLSYQPSPVSVGHDGHTITVHPEGANSLSVGGRRFDLAQFHFHAPSEHTIDGQHAPIEMHWVHRDASGGLAVVGVMFKEGRHNTAYDDLWAALPQGPSTAPAPTLNLDLMRLLPLGQEHYHYPGSLTTPPCTENVDWYVLQVPVQLSREQITAFRAILFGNNRPVQPLHDRVIGADR